VESTSFLQFPFGLIDDQLGDVRFHENEDVNQQSRDDTDNWKPDRILFSPQRHNPIAVDGRFDSIGHAELFSFNLRHEVGDDDENCDRNGNTKVAEEFPRRFSEEFRSFDDLEGVGEGEGSKRQKRAVFGWF
jgi:hypothetical protein